MEGNYIFQRARRWWKKPVLWWLQHALVKNPLEGTWFGVSCQISFIWLLWDSCKLNYGVSIYRTLEVLFCDSNSDLITSAFLRSIMNHTCYMLLLLFFCAGKTEYVYARVKESKQSTFEVHSFVYNDWIILFSETFELLSSDYILISNFWDIDCFLCSFSMQFFYLKCHFFSRVFFCIQWHYSIYSKIGNQSAAWFHLWLH